MQTGLQEVDEMRASLVLCGIVVGMLCACETSDGGNPQDSLADAVGDGSGLNEVDSVGPVGDVDASGEGDLADTEELVDTVPGDQADMLPDLDAPDGSDWSLSDDISSFELGVALIPDSNEGFPGEYDAVKFRLYEGGMPCSAFGAVASDTASAVQEKMTNSVEASPVFGPLGLDGNYTVVVRVSRDEGGQTRVVAWGCTDQIVASSDATTTGSMGAQVALQMVMLESGGSYEYFEEYTLDEEFFGSPLMQTMSQLEGLLSDPGTVFLSFLDAHLLPTLSGVSDTAYNAFLEELESVVAAQLMGAEPPLASGDLESVVNAMLNPRFEGTLELVQTGADVTASGTMERLVLTWQFNGQPQVWTQSLASPQSEGAGASWWTGEIVDVSQLLVAESVMEVDLGGLYVGAFLNSSVLPAATGSVSLSGYLESLLDCTAIAAALSSEVLSGVGLSAESFREACLATVGEMEETIGGQLETVAMPVTLYRQGTCTLVDAFGDAEDQDLEVESLTEGVWTGVSLCGAGEAPLSGTFGATRIPPAN